MNKQQKFKKDKKNTQDAYKFSVIQYIKANGFKSLFRIVNFEMLLQFILIFGTAVTLTTSIYYGWYKQLIHVKYKFFIMIAIVILYACSYILAKKLFTPRKQYRLASYFVFLVVVGLGILQFSCAAAIKQSEILAMSDEERQFHLSDDLGLKVEKLEDVSLDDVKGKDPLEYNLPNIPGAVKMDNTIYGFWMYDFLNDEHFSDRSYTILARVFSDPLDDSNYIFGRNVMRCCIADLETFGFRVKKSDPMLQGMTIKEGDWYYISGKASTALDPIYSYYEQHMQLSHIERTVSPIVKHVFFFPTDLNEMISQAGA